MTDTQARVAAAMAQAKATGEGMHYTPVATPELPGSPDIAKFLYDYARDLPPKVITKISPSMIGGCMRRHWYAIKGAPITTPTNPGYILNMQTGFMWEELITKALQKSGIPFISQWKMVSSKFYMEGTLDYGLLLDNELQIWDSKTESSLAKNYRNGSYLNAHEEYMHQQNAYAIMARERGFTVTRGGFIVIRRDDTFAENHPFMFDELRIAETEARIRRLEKNLENNTLPECDGKFCKLGLCPYGNPETQKENSKGKMVNTECCPLPRVLKSWSDKLEESKNAKPETH